MNRMELLVPVEECPVRTTPDDVRCELSVQDVGIALVVARLETGGERVDCAPGLHIHCSEGWAAGGGRRHGSRLTVVDRLPRFEVSGLREALTLQVPTPRDGRCDLEGLARLAVSLNDAGLAVDA
jgi:hypothetical protein